MDFTDGNEFTDTFQIDYTEPQSESVQEEYLPPEQIIQPSPSPVPDELPEELPGDVQASGSESSETVEESEPEVTPTPEVSYQELLEELKIQTEEIKAVHEIAEKNQEYYESYRNIGITVLIGAGLLIGSICTLIIANYIRH
ncbi:MAG: hypothetical protein ACI4C4_11850 [Lachnospiraceae bacterium]